MTFTVTVLPSGASFQVERDESILSAAIQQGIGLPYGCKDGACGSCKCRIIDGRVIHGAHQAKALSNDEEDAGFTLTCCAAPQTHIILEAQAVASADVHPVRKMPCRVMSLERPTLDVTVLKLQLPASDTLAYRAGQYIEFLLNDGTRRSYSMANAWVPGTDRPYIELHLRHMPGGKFTDHVFGAMQVKDILRLEGPFGTFFLRDDSTKPIVLLAGGTGFAPIKAIIEHMSRTSVHRHTTLYWGCRSRADLYAHAWAKQASKDLPHLTYVPVLSDAHEADKWAGRTGWVHQAVLQDLPDLSQHQVYACGAPAMVESARRDFVQLAGLPESEFFADAFTSEADKH